MRIHCENYNGHVVYFQKVMFWSWAKGILRSNSEWRKEMTTKFALSKFPPIVAWDYPSQKGTMYHDLKITPMVAWDAIYFLTWEYCSSSWWHENGVSGEGVADPGVKITVIGSWSCSNDLQQLCKLQLSILGIRIFTKKPWEQNSLWLDLQHSISYSVLFDGVASIMPCSAVNVVLRRKVGEKVFIIYAF